MKNVRTGGVDVCGCGEGLMKLVCFLLFETPRLGGDSSKIVSME